MKTEVYMPAMSPSMTEGTLTKWLVKVGDHLKIGDPIAEIETDKASMEVESQIEGVISEFLVENGQDQIAVKTPIAIIETNTSTEKLKGKLFTNTIDDQPKKKIIKDRVIDQDKKQDKISVREAIRDALAEEMRRDKNVFVMGEEVAEYQGAYKVTQGLLQEFGASRVIDTPITENGFAGLAIGASFSGLKPVVEFMTFNFSLQAMDHIINSAAKTLYMGGGQLNCPIVFRGPNGAAARVAAQHSQDLTAWFSHIPGLKVISPFSARDHKGLLKAAIRDPNPVIFLENEILYSDQESIEEDNDDVISIGKAKILREGSDITLISHSISLKMCLEASKKLAKKNIDCEVLDLRTIKPLDTKAIISSIQKTNKCVVVEQGWSQCGVSSEIISVIMENAFDWLDAPVLRLTGKDVPMPYAENLENLALPSEDELIKIIESLFE
ncbi:MAG: pyruvate dehydrogenase complex E1 component subunit beta [Rhodobiaceae bacterium]|nr:pyruvate dehydrogenase complex E1 component subunit beta [Rhodobiaceae bacterium]MEC7087892.1 pyruvate dehydrogenase complex E1 component subunit beta [Pseudomonadota bacterium]MEC7270406.1 pyruvate dehydrogenase complex E1 component subunit beta [Pseudomonadota bacterium]MEC8447239.1 pyruvate dehydrogenase complex E1 component subunit beta [Pseudomonadota bacterium]|tara:strand:+ start:9441 stop:10760 length:1320 start_codon:yes stop_codon:yes gene_type:complete